MTINFQIKLARQEFLARTGESFEDFLLEYGGETNISPDEQQQFRNSKNRVLKWRPISVKSDIVDLRKQVGSLENVTAYAFCQIESAVEEVC